MNQQLKITLWVALGGSLGTLCRFTLDLLLTQPTSTWLANVLGSFLLATFAGLTTTRTSTHPSQFGLTVGFCGAFTTMSTLMANTASLYNANSPTAAALYLAASLSIGLLATFAGFALGKYLAKPRPPQPAHTPPQKP